MPWPLFFLLYKFIIDYVFGKKFVGDHGWMSIIFANRKFIGFAERLSVNIRG